MIKEIIVAKCSCEKCQTVVKPTDTYCSKCGNKLDENVEYIEEPRTRGGYDTIPNWESSWE